MIVKLILLVILAVSSFSASVDELPRDSCSSSEFSCSEGGCISLNLVCDGSRDCAEGGDELGCDSILLNSSSTDLALDQPRSQVFGCRKNEWACWDGSCIASRFQCDGVIDCEDGSDENIAACRASIYMRSLAVVAKLAGTYQQNSLLEGTKYIEKLVGFGLNATHSSHIQQYTCVLPEYPSFGTYNTIDVPNAKPRDTFDSVTIDVICQNGYGVDRPSSMVKCQNGVWLGLMPNCVSQCYLPPNPTVKYRCVVSGDVIGSRDCNENEPVGTVVDPQCQSNYYSPTPIMYMRCNNHGQWDNIVKCIQECGTVTADGTGLIHGGRKAKKAEVPWHAGIYTKTKNPYEQICGGSLISNNIIISAAHCFWDDKLEELPATDYAVAVGKLYRPWDDSMDEAQKSNIKELHFPDHFQGSKTHFQSDIVLIITTIRFKFNSFIRPVCVDFDYGFDTIQLQPEQKGKVAGWGLTETGKESPVLQVLELPFVSIEQCRRDSPESFHPYINNDKFCAGFNKTGQAVCKGDSGGGLAFPSSERDKKRYYLRGIVSTAPTNDYDTCNAYAYTCFTHLRIHDRFIKNFWTADDLSNTDTPIGFDDDILNRPQESLCILPPYPDHGNYSTNIPSAKPGGAFNSVELNITCQQGYGVNGSSFVYCINGQWSEKIPKCVSQCYLKPHPSVEYRCLVSGLIGSFRPCNEYEITGSVASPQCRSPNFYSPTVLPLMRCIDGHWDYVARCHPECGTVTSDSTDLIIGGKLAAKRMVPWHAGIYTKTMNLLVCGGSLISNSVVISAAHCIYTESVGPLPASNFVVEVGNSNDTQRSDVQEIHLSLRYAGSVTNFQDDISILIVQMPFKYTLFIQPVCVDFDYDFEKKQLQPGKNGKMAGWSMGEDGNSSQVLQVVNLPYVSVRKCITESSDIFRAYITADKICAGFVNGSGSLCKGSSGSGLAFPEKDAIQQRERFYIRGILSGVNFESSNGDCTTNTFLKFTQVLNHEHFIKQFWLDDLDDAGSNRSQKHTCKLPDYPAHGTYVTNTPDTKPGDAFDILIINVTCNQGYEVVGSNTVYCYHGLWTEKLPTCVSLCHLKPDPAVEYRCLVSQSSEDGESSRPCNEYEPSGTVASPQCRQPFYSSETTLPFIRCIDGNWDDTIKTCLPECGTVSPAGTPLIVGGQSAKRAEAPWHADIYNQITDSYKPICGGSLVSESVVISAAHCFWSSTTGRLEPPTNFAVAVGKLFYLWEDSKNNAQRSNVMEVHLPARFQGINANYQDDIAVVVVVKPFDLMMFIRPICVDFDVSYERKQFQQGKIGRVAGWGRRAANKNSAQVLKVVDVPYVDIETCIAEAPEVLLQFISSDKICSNLTETAFCLGDSGSGLAFPELDRGIERYYLRGILASVTKFENKCSEKMTPHFLLGYWRMKAS